MFETALTTLDTSTGLALAWLGSAAPFTGATALLLAGLALAAVASSAWSARRRARRLETVLGEALGRLTATELLLAATTADLSQARGRLDQMTGRHDATATASQRGGFRQAIALSRHGATTRQLIDTCGLSQGEAHLIQTLYGRPPAGQAEELH